jgi:hypothetical protein
MANFLRTFLAVAVLAPSAHSGPGYLPIPQETVASENDGVWQVTTSDRPFAEVRTRSLPRPVLYPVFGPSGLPMTRRWPMEEAEGEEHDHPHHRGLWFAHGDVNGVDFWAEGAGSGRITVQDCRQEAATKGIVTVVMTCRWQGPKGDTVCSDRRRLTFAAGKHWRTIDFEIALSASEGDLRLGDTKEGTMALRLAEPLRVKGKGATGHYLNSEGMEDGHVWGKRAAWVDAWGTVDGRIIGVALFDHGTNPRHPTWWHARDYGLFAANPFGIHDFEKKPKGSGDMVIPKGESRSWKYRFYFHDGDPAQARIADQWKRWAANRSLEEDR